MSKQLMPTPTSRYFYPWPVVLVSCVDEDGKPNAITIGASSICSSNPPTVGVAVGVAQYSLGLIERTGDFGVNIPRADQLWATDYCGSHSGRSVNKLQAVGMTAVPSTQIASPLLDECPVSMECRLIHRVNLGNHDWLIGQIVAVHVDESVLDAAGHLDPAKTDPLLSFWGEYWSIGERLDDWHSSR
jgi:flavin reductase (DIM6/NTAB) family NADH-FMN oxidoreductase RutF